MASNYKKYEIGQNICIAIVSLLVLFLAYCIISLLCSLHKPSEFVCTDVAYQVESTQKGLPFTSNLIDAEKEAKRKAFLGRPISISWYDNDLKLIIMSGNIPETYIFTQERKDIYRYKNTNGLYIDLFIDRTIGYLTRIYLICFTEDENGELQYSYSLTLTPQ